MGAAATQFSTRDWKQPVLAASALIFCASAVGITVAGAGGSSSSQLLMGSAAIIIAIAGALCFAFQLPIIAVARFTFIASFFFKGDLNLFKVDEVEDPSGLNVSLTLVVALFLMIYDVVQDRSEERIFPQSFSYLCVALFLCAAISVVFGDSAALGGYSLFSFLTSVLIAFAVASHFSNRVRLLQLIGGVAAGLIFTGAVALSQYVVDFPTTLPSFGTGTEDELLGTQSQILSRVPAFMRTPTEMAWVLSALIPLVVALVVTRVHDLAWRYKAFLLSGAFAGVVAIILSLARGSWISLVVGIVMVVALGWYKLPTRERSSYAARTAVSIIFACLLLMPFAGRIYDRLNDDDQGSALIRVPLMETALRMIDDNPLVGVGINGYRPAMTRYDNTGIFVSQVFPNPVHNVFAHITAEIGVPGGIIFCLLFAACLFECFRSMAAGDRLMFAVSLGIAAGLLAFIISAMKEPGSLGSARPPIRTLFFLFGTGLAVARMRRRLML
ncbi:MAG: O-antigen ligase family protein [Pyrinomonadaceae bacterium]